MRVLFVAPYPPSRIRVRSYGFLQGLRREHEVVVVALCRSRRELEDVEVLRGQGYEVVAVQEREWKGVVRSGMALVGSRSLQMAYARSRGFAEVLQGLCMRERFDVVHVEHVRGMAAIGPLARDLPVVWDAVDCVSLLYKYAMGVGPSLAMRMVARVEQRRLQEYEARMVRMVRHVVVTSERDRGALMELGRVHAYDGADCQDQGGSRRLESGEGEGEGMTSRIKVLPNGVDLDYFRPLREKRRRFNIVFSGTMSYHPNVATALYLYRRVMPLIWERRPEVTLTLVGSGPQKVIRRLAGDGRVEVTGYVEDMRPFIGRAEVMVCPMVYGVGIQNKVLEAMAMGTPVVVTPQVAEVFEVRQGRDLLVAETPEGFAEAALGVLDDVERWSMLSRYGRAYVERHHDWRAVTERLVGIYSQAIRSFRGAR